MDSLTFLEKGPKGEPLPVYAHVPVLVNERRQKLSKRRDRVAVEDYRDVGYLPEAMVNFLALLGWGPGDDREILSREELIDAFRLEDVNVSPAYFDEKRLAHFNGLYLRALSVEEFDQRLAPFLSAPDLPWPPDRFDPSAVRTHVTFFHGEADRTVSVAVACELARAVPGSRLRVYAEHGHFSLLAESGREILEALVDA